MSVVRPDYVLYMYTLLTEYYIILNLSALWLVNKMPNNLDNIGFTKKITSGVHNLLIGIVKRNSKIDGMVMGPLNAKNRASQ